MAFCSHFLFQCIFSPSILIFFGQKQNTKPWWQQAQHSNHSKQRKPNHNHSKSTLDQTRFTAIFSLGCLSNQTKFTAKANWQTTKPISQQAMFSCIPNHSHSKCSYWKLYNAEQSLTQYQTIITAIFQDQYSQTRYQTINTARSRNLLFICKYQTKTTARTHNHSNFPRSRFSNSIPNHKHSKI